MIISAAAHYFNSQSAKQAFKKIIDHVEDIRSPIPPAGFM